jgi:hypothetical protein
MEIENPKHTDHHFTKMSEYKYTLEFVEPRKSYEELQKELDLIKERLDHNFSILKLEKNLNLTHRLK